MVHSLTQLNASRNCMKVISFCVQNAPLSIFYHQLGSKETAVYEVVFLHESFSDNAQGRLFATHTKCVEGVLGEWADQVLYI